MSTERSTKWQKKALKRSKAPAPRDVDDDSESDDDQLDEAEAQWLAKRRARGPVPRKSAATRRGDMAGRVAAPPRQRRRRRDAGDMAGCAG